MVHPLIRSAAILVVAFLTLESSLTSAQQRAGGPRRQGQSDDPQFAADRELFHFLLEHRDEIRRKVTPRADGVETVTESDNPEVTKAIREHVGSMERRVQDDRPIHLRDPLFAAVFQHADQIKFHSEDTAKGVRVVETSQDAYVVKLVQAHAEVVSLFLKNGFEEVRRSHAVPSRQ